MGPPPNFDVSVVTTSRAAVQRDPEPERNLLRRPDQWNFLKAAMREHG